MHFRIHMCAAFLNCMDQAVNATHHERRALLLQERVVNLYDAVLATPLKRTLRNSLAAGAALVAGQGLQFWVYALSFWYGGQLVASGEMTLSNTLKVLCFCVCA